MSREHLSRSLKHAHVREYLEGRSERARDLLKAQSPMVLLHLMEHAQSERLRAEIAIRASGIGARENASPLVNINVQPGYVVKLAGPADDKPLIERDNSEGEDLT